MTEKTHQPEKIRVGKLQTIDNLEVELRRVYRHTRKGVVKTEDGWRLAKILQMMVQIKRETDLEERIQKLEESYHAGL